MKLFGLATVMIFMTYVMVASGRPARDEQAMVATLGPPPEVEDVIATEANALKGKGGREEEAPASIVVEGIILGSLIAGR